MREIILNILMTVSAKEEYSHIVIRDVLAKYNYLEGNEKSFIKRVAEGTLERRLELDYVINQFSKLPVKKMKPLIRDLLRMSTYQLLYMDNVPASAVCNEAVKLAEKRKFQNLKGFVNGVLRNISKNKEDIRYPSKEKDAVLYYSIKYSMPVWLVRLWMEEQDENVVEKMLDGLLSIRPVTIRMVETLPLSKQEKIIANMEKQDVRVRKHPYLEYAYLLENLEGVANLYGYDEGYYTVQDVSSMLAVEAAGIQSGDKVLDVCAAPGGKTMHAAVKTGETGVVEARDVSDYKVEQIEENISRMKLKNVVTKVADASVYDEKKEEWADVVLADVPCSGLGVIGKKRDIKYNITEESLTELEGLQKKILGEVWKYVKKGGVFLFSTCTIHRAENEDMVKWIEENCPLKLESLEKVLSKETICALPKTDSTQLGYMQLLPGIYDTDGFFFARFRRV